MPQPLTLPIEQMADRGLVVNGVPRRDTIGLNLTRRPVSEQPIHTYDFSKIDFSKIEVFEAGAAVVALLACPEGDREDKRHRLHASVSTQAPRFRSRCAATSWRTTATIRGRCNSISGTARYSIRFAIPLAAGAFDGFRWRD